MERSLSENISDYGHKTMYTLGYIGTAGILIKTSYDVFIEKDLSHIFESLEALAILALGSRSIHGRHELNMYADEIIKDYKRLHPEMDVERTITSSIEEEKGFWGFLTPKKVRASRNLDKLHAKHNNTVVKAKNVYRKKTGEEIDISAEAEKLDTHSNEDVYRKLKTQIEVSEEIIAEHV